MRFVTFVSEGRARAGVLLDDRFGQYANHLIDGAHPRRPRALQALEPTMRAWVEACLVELSLAIKQSSPAPECLIPQNAVRLLAPIPRPGKIVGAAFNYKDGLAVSNRPAPEEPVIFVKSGCTVVGPEDPIALPPGHEVTYEAELAAIIGKPAALVKEDEAMAHVCGFAAFNDVSFTNLVREDGCFVRGKNQPTSGPFGPWIVSADDMHDPYALAIRLAVNGRTLQDSTTAEMLFRIDSLIAYASARIPLDCGDVIATGTPAGVAINHQPPAWLKPGQRVSINIEFLGELSNPVVEAQQ